MAVAFGSSSSRDLRWLNARLGSECDWSSVPVHRWLRAPKSKRALIVDPRQEREFSDRQLIRRARDGSREAVEALIGRHWDRAHRIAYGVVGDAQAAEDVTQEAMLSLTANIGRFDPYRPFAPWLHTIVANRARDWARARARRAEVSVDPLEQRASRRLLVSPISSLSRRRVTPIWRWRWPRSPDQRAAIVLGASWLATAPSR